MSSPEAVASGRSIPVAPTSALISRHSLTEFDVRVLKALEPSRYQTIDIIREVLSLQRSVARAELMRLGNCDLVEDNGEHPLAFRRTVFGDEALKWFD
jgi:predicted transcriptional regulator